MHRFPSCISCDFRVFFELFSLDFRARLVPLILGCLSSDFLVGSRIYALCIFVLDLDPSNSGFGLGFEDFGWNPSFLVELGCDSIPSDLLRLRSQVLGYSIP
jgi:hypothetical protein